MEEGSFLVQLFFASLSVGAAVLIQMAGLTMIAWLLGRLEGAPGSDRPHIRHAQIMGLVVWCLFLLHLAQIAVYAAMYWLSGSIQPFDTALYFSATTFATIGYGDVPTEERWRIFAAMEGLNGIILVGWSVAFLITIVGRLGLWARRK